ncbi:MAG: hypothetical protein Q4G39_07700 [Brachymonas sp.]|nr:hypothetical protein [Brachymonas sp.]
MIFALSTDDRCLEVFKNEAAAISCAEGIDVENGVWCFFDESGQALEPVFTKPNQVGDFCVVSGTYHLRLASPNTPSLQSKLSDIQAVEKNCFFKSLAEVAAWLVSD